MTVKFHEGALYKRYGFGYADLMDIFSVSKTQACKYLRLKAKPSLEAVQGLAVSKVGEPEGKLAIEILTLRGTAIPCVCQTEVGDCGPCPKHGAVSKDTPKNKEGKIS